jgi:hypothetical protein
VTAAGSGAPLAATLTVKTSDANGDPVPFFASSGFGFYARPLAPGTHTLVAAADGYAMVEAEVTVPIGGRGVVKNFKLRAQGSSGEDGGGSSGSGEEEEGAATTAADAAQGSGRGSGSGGGGAAGERAGKLQASMYILAIHGAVFAIIAVASGCQGSGAAQVVCAYLRSRRQANSRFEV